jgi:hypothetical protein
MRASLVLFLVACGGAEPAVETPAVEAPAAAAADAAAPAGDWSYFGAPFTAGESVTLASVLDNPATYTGRTVRVEGRIADVCQQAGCWLVLADGERTIRITAKEHGFSVDKDTTSAWADLEGVVVEIPPDPDRVAHLRSEAQNPDAMPENSGMRYEIEASSIRIRRGA